jgi:hypothetical protein
VRLFYKFPIEIILQPITLVYFRKLPLIGCQKLLRMWVIYSMMVVGIRSKGVSLPNKGGLSLRGLLTPYCEEVA